MNGWWNLIYIVLLGGFFLYLSLGMRKVSRYDDPEYVRKQEEHAERILCAAEKQADALDRLATEIKLGLTDGQRE